jgi:hypothetical protein
MKSALVTISMPIWVPLLLVAYLTVTGYEIILKIARQRH